MKNTAVQKGALNIGSRLASMGKSISTGVKSTLNFGTDVAKKTGDKIKSTDTKIVAERKKQDRIRASEKETLRRGEREAAIEAKKGGRAGAILSTGLASKAKSFLQFLFTAWIVKNGPTILKELEIFTKKVKIFVAAIKKAVVGIGDVYKATLAFANALIQNLIRLDWKDSEKRLERAREEMDTALDDVGTSFSDMKNVWNKNEEELDKMLEELERENSINETLMDIELEQRNAAVPGSPMLPGGGGRENQSVDTFNGETGSPTRLLDIHRRALDKISQYESAGSGGYDAMNQGTVTDRRGNPPRSGNSKNIIGKRLTDMTVEEVLAAQNKKLNNDEGFIHAAGRYQFIGNTLPGVVADSGIDPKRKFDKETQDILAVTLMRQRGVAPWLADKRTGLLNDQAGMDLINRAGQTPLASTPQMPTGPQQKPVPNSGGNMTAPQQSGVGRAADASGNVLGSNILYSKDFNTTNPNVPSQFIKTSGRGMRWGRMHQGVDFGNGNQKGWYCGLLLDGVVSYTGYDSGGGNMAFIKVGGLEYVFMHLARYSPGIRQGAKYTAGQPIGEVGNTGKGTGIHLHFEIRRNNKPFDPEPYIKYVVFGKLKRRSTNTSSLKPATSSTQVASATSDALASKRTGVGSNKNKIEVIRQREIVMVG